MQQIYSPFQQYQRQQEHEIRAASPVKLIGMLLEGAILFNKKSMAALEEKRVTNALEMADRAHKIVVHLYNCLNFDQGGEISEKLGTLYSYLLDQFIVFFKGSRDPNVLKNINNILGIIYDGWKQIEGKTPNAG